MIKQLAFATISIAMIGFASYASQVDPRDIVQSPPDCIFQEHRPTVSFQLLIVPVHEMNKTCKALGVKIGTGVLACFGKNTIVMPPVRSYPPIVWNALLRHEMAHARLLVWEDGVHKFVAGWPASHPNNCNFLNRGK